MRRIRVFIFDEPQDIETTDVVLTRWAHDGRPQWVLDLLHMNAWIVSPDCTPAENEILQKDYIRGIKTWMEDRGFNYGFEGPE